MDTTSYLRSRGWKGDGHGLGKSQSGIRKPLLISKKKDVLGLGLDKHRALSDQWWLRAFDQGLKNLGSGRESALAQVQKHGAARGGLYGRFVRGEALAGSIDTTPCSSGTETPVEAPSVAIEMSSNESTQLNGVASAPSRKRKRENNTESPAQVASEGQDRRRPKSSKSTNGAHGSEDQSVDQGVRHIVKNAYAYGVIPAGASQIAKGLKPDENLRIEQATTDPAVREMYEKAVKTCKGYKSMSTKAKKITREKALRELKRSARTYLFPNQQGRKKSRADSQGDKSEQEIKAAKKAAKKERKAKTELLKKKGTTKAERRKEKEARRDARRLARKEKRAAKRSGAGPASESVRVAAAAAAAAAVPAPTLVAPVASKAPGADDFAAGSDEIKLGGDSKAVGKEIPHVGRVTRYPTKGEKKAKKRAAQAILASGPEDVPGNIYGLSSEKLAKYTKRAAGRNMSLADYMTTKQKRVAR